MSISVSPITIIRGSGGGTLTSFADSFNRASGRLGTDWHFGIQPNGSANPIEAPLPSIGVSTLDGLQCLQWITITTGNPQSAWFGHLICAPLYIPLMGKNQFSQWTMIRSNTSGGNAILGGPSVLHSASGVVDCYTLASFDDKSWRLDRRNANVFTHLANAGPGTLANGDVLYLQAVINAGNTTLIAKRNGATIATVVDTSASRLTTGSVGFQMQDMGGSSGQTYQHEWRNFSGGKL